MKRVNKIKNVERYDEFIKRKKANFFYQRFWLEFLEGVEKNPVYFYRESEGKIKSFLGLSSAGRDYYCMPWWVSEKVFVSEDAGEFIKEFKKLNADEVIFDNISEKQAKKFEKNGFVIYPKYLYPELRVSSMDGFWKGLRNSRKRKDLRKAIKNAEDSGLEIVEVSSYEDLKSYFSLEKMTMKRNNAVAFPLKYWKGIYEKVPKDKLLFLLVKKGDVVIAGRISFVDENKIFNYRSVSLKKFQKYHANELLHIYVIKEAIRRGIFLIDYGAGEINRVGSYMFKKKIANGERFLWSAVYPLNVKSKEKHLKIAKKNFEKLNIFLRGIDGK